MKNKYLAFLLLMNIFLAVFYLIACAYFTWHSKTYAIWATGIISMIHIWSFERVSKVYHEK